MFYMKCKISIFYAHIISRTSQKHPQKRVHYLEKIHDLKQTLAKNFTLKVHTQYLLKNPVINKPGFLNVKKIIFY